MLAQIDGIQLNISIILQTVTAILLVAGLRWLLSLKSMIDVMQKEKVYQDKELERFNKHVESAHVQPSQFESLRTLVEKINDKMTLVWYEMEEEKKRKNRERGEYEK